MHLQIEYIHNVYSSIEIVVGNWIEHFIQSRYAHVCIVELHSHIFKYYFVQLNAITISEWIITHSYLLKSIWMLTVITTPNYSYSGSWGQQKAHKCVSNFPMYTTDATVNFSKPEIDTYVLARTYVWSQTITNQSPPHVYQCVVQMRSRSYLYEMLFG